MTVGWHAPRGESVSSKHLSPLARVVRFYRVQHRHVCPLQLNQCLPAAFPLCTNADDGDIESLPQEKQEQFQEMRCSSMGRGSMYDSVVGECCWCWCCVVVSVCVCVPARCRSLSVRDLPEPTHALPP